MPKLALINIVIGFWLLFLAAAAGAFIATDLSSTYLADKAFHDTWLTMLTKSAHGHTNLFGLLHICYGLTLPHSPLALKWKSLQTFGLICGSFAMGPGLIIRGYQGPKPVIDPIAIVIGILLSAALAALFSHASALSSKLIRRG
jgi:hypothetical protein